MLFTDIEGAEGFRDFSKRHPQIVRRAREVTEVLSGELSGLFVDDGPSRIDFVPEACVAIARDAAKVSIADGAQAEVSNDRFTPASAVGRSIFITNAYMQDVTDGSGTVAGICTAMDQLCKRGEVGTAVLSRLDAWDGVNVAQQPRTNIHPDPFGPVLMVADGEGDTLVADFDIEVPKKFGNGRLDQLVEGHTVVRLGKHDVAIGDWSSRYHQGQASQGNGRMTLLAYCQPTAGL